MLVGSEVNSTRQVEVIISGNQDISRQEIWALLCLRMFCIECKLLLMIQLKTGIETRLECVFCRGLVLWDTSGKSRQEMVKAM